MIKNFDSCHYETYNPPKNNYIIIGAKIRQKNKLRVTKVYLRLFQVRLDYVMIKDYFDSCNYETYTIT